MPLTHAEATNLLNDIPGWTLETSNNAIRRDFRFNGFYATMSFVNAIAYIAEREGHHPDLHVGYNYLTVKFTTHAIKGLSENDFICAAKVSALL